MANWKYKLKIGSIWNSEKSIEEKGALIAAKMRQVFPKNWLDFTHDDHDYELEEIVEALENITGYGDTSPIDEFDNWWSVFYNWADYDHRCWADIYSG